MRNFDSDRIVTYLLITQHQADEHENEDGQYDYKDEHAHFVHFCSRCVPSPRLAGLSMSVALARPGESNGTEMWATSLDEKVESMEVIRIFGTVKVADSGTILSQFNPHNILSSAKIISYVLFQEDVQQSSSCMFIPSLS